jgi:hypothetical protein
MFQANLDQEILDRQAADTALNDTISSTATSLMGTIGSVLDMLNQEILDRQSGDADTLAAANLYTDNAIAAIPTFDPANYYNKTEVDQLLLEESENRIFGDSQLQLAIDQADGLISENGEAITALQLQLSEVSGQVLTNSEKIAVIEADIDQLQLDVDAVELVAGQAQLEVDALELRTGTLETEMDTAQADIVSLDGRVDTLEGLVMNVHVHSGNLNAAPYKIYLLSGVSTVKLPAPSINKTLMIKKTGSDLVTLEPHHTEQIEGVAANYLLTSTRQSATLVSDGTDWFII